MRGSARPRSSTPPRRPSACPTGIRTPGAFALSQNVPPDQGPHGPDRARGDARGDEDPTPSLFSGQARVGVRSGAVSGLMEGGPPSGASPAPVAPSAPDARVT